jgi:hypothetical protein
MMRGRMKSSCPQLAQIDQDLTPSMGDLARDRFFQGNPEATIINSA